MENELSVMLLRNEVFAQASLLSALIETHPDKDKLLSAFTRISEQHIATSLALPMDDTAIRAFTMFRDRWTKQISDAINHVG